jgi:hypothetical protein
MKKMLVLFVIASLTAMANGAMSLNISVGGSTSVTEITLAPSGHLVLDIKNTGDFTQSADPAISEAGYFGLIADSDYGLITGGVTTAAAPSASSFDTDPADYADLVAIYGDDGVFCSIGAWNTGTYDGGIYFDEIDFHCVAAGDVTIQLISTGPGMDEWHLLDSVLVHQVTIPEPTTVCLLSIGGLLLRRFKK